MAEFNRKETDKRKEELKETWAQKLFNDYYPYHWHQPNELTAMAELIYENTGVKVVQPGSSDTVVGHYSPSGERSQTVYKGKPEKHFDWSRYED